MLRSWENKEVEVWQYYIKLFLAMNLKKNPWDFATLPLEILDKAKLQFHKIVLHCCLKIPKFKAKNQAPIANCTWVFLDPLKFYSFFNEQTSTPDPHNTCLGFFWNSPPFGPQSLKVFPHQYDEKILFGQLFFLHFSLERQDNHLQEFFLREISPFSLLLLRRQLMLWKKAKIQNKKSFMWQWSRY